jgi:hypothetical protein
MSPFLRLQLLLLLGNIAFIGAWVLALYRPTGWQWMGVLLLAFFVAIRVGGSWLRVRQFPDVARRTRRAAILSTVVALLAVALWIYTALREPA